MSDDVIQLTKSDWDNAEQLAVQIVEHRVACRAHGAPPNVVGVIAPYLAGHRVEAVAEQVAALTRQLAEARAEVERLKIDFQNERYFTGRIVEAVYGWLRGLGTHLRLMPWLKGSSDSLPMMPPSPTQRRRTLKKSNRLSALLKPRSRLRVEAVNSWCRSMTS